MVLTICQWRERVLIVQNRGGKLIHHFGLSEMDRQKSTLSNMTKVYCEIEYRIDFCTGTDIVRENKTATGILHIWEKVSESTRDTAGIARYN